MRLIILLGFVCACAPLDRRSPFASAQYYKAVKQTEAALTNTQTSVGNYLVGWSKTKIDSPKNVPLAGFGQRKGVNSTGVLDPCFVRAFSISIDQQNVIIITADILAADRRLSTYVREQLASVIDPNSVIFTASHTHSGPGAYIPGIYEIAFGTFDQESFDAIANAMISAAKQAQKNMRPARIAYEESPAPGLIKNRVEKDGTTDDLLSLFYFEHITSGQKAAIWSFAAHPVTKTHENLKLSADYPGTVAREFENSELDLLAFVSGAIGSMNPKIEGGKDSWLTQPLSKKLGQLIAKAQQNGSPSGRLSFVSTEIDFPPMKYRIAPELMLLPQLTRAVVASPSLLIQALSLGDSTILTLPGEISGQLIKPMRQNKAKPLSVWSLNGNYIGYLVPRRVYNLPTEAHDKLFKYETQIMNFLGPWGADYLMNIGARLIEAVQSDR